MSITLPLGLFNVKRNRQGRMIFFFGRPPRVPFARAVAPLRALVDWPPFRPRATACGFLRFVIS